MLISDVQKKKISSFSACNPIIKKKSSEMLHAFLLPLLLTIFPLFLFLPLPLSISPPICLPLFLPLPLPLFLSLFLPLSFLFSPSFSILFYIFAFLLLLVVSPRGCIKWGEKARNKVRDLLGYIEKEIMKRWKKGKKIRQIVHGRKKLEK